MTQFPVTQFPMTQAYRIPKSEKNFKLACCTWVVGPINFGIRHSDLIRHLHRGLAEMSGQALCFRMLSSRRPDTGKCPRHTQEVRIQSGTVLMSYGNLESFASTDVDVL